MQMINKILNKIILVVGFLKNNEKIEILILIIWIFFMYNDKFLNFKYVILCYLLLYLYMYLFNLYCILLTNYLEKKQLSLINKKDKQLYIRELEKIINILIKINYYYNFIYILLYKLEIKLYYFFRLLNYNFINDLWLRKIIYMFIMSIIIMPIHLIFYLYFIYLEKLLNGEILSLIFKRIDGLIFYILLLLLNNINIYLFILFLYLLLVITSIFFLNLPSNVRKEKTWLFSYMHIKNYKIYYTFFGVLLEWLLCFYIDLSGKRIENDLVLLSLKAKKSNLLSFNCILLEQFIFKDIMIREVKYSFFFSIYSILYDKLLWINEIRDMEYYLLIEKDEEKIKIINLNMQYIKDIVRSVFLLILEINDNLKIETKLKLNKETALLILLDTDYEFLQNNNNLKEKIQKFSKIMENKEKILSILNLIDIFENQSLMYYHNQKNELFEQLNESQIKKFLPIVYQKQLKWLIELKSLNDNKFNYRLIINNKEFENKLSNKKN